MIVLSCSQLQIQYILTQIVPKLTSDSFRKKLAEMI